MTATQENDANKVTMPFNQPSDLAQMGCSTNGKNTPLPAACAWCQREDGIVPEPGSNQSHGVCARHFCMTLLEGGNIPAQAIKDRAARMYGAAEGLAAFEAAVLLVARGLARA